MNYTQDLCVKTNVALINVTASTANVLPQEKTNIHKSKYLYVIYICGIRIPK